jgi:hypothetical protein
MTCDNGDEKRARNREYQRTYRARLHVKANGNKKEHADPKGAKLQGLIINNVTTLLLCVIDVEHTGLQVMIQKNHKRNTWRVSIL